MQQLGKDLSRRSKAEAFSWRVIVEESQVNQSIRRKSGQICFAGQPAAQTADGVFDPAFLPGGMRIAEEGLNAELIAHTMMQGEFRTVVEGERTAQAFGQWGEQGMQAIGDRRSGFAGLSNQSGQTRGALMQGQSGLAVEGEQHQVGLPVARLRAIGSGGGSLRERNATLDVIHRTTPFASTPAAFTLRLRQIVAPRVIVRARKLRGDETINRFVADATTLVLREPSGDGLWCPSQAQPLQNEFLQ